MHLLSRGLRHALASASRRLRRASDHALTTPWRSAVFKLRGPIPGNFSLHRGELPLHVIDVLALPVPSVVVRYDPTIYTKAAVAGLLSACGLPVGEELVHRAGSMQATRILLAAEAV